MSWISAVLVIDFLTLIVGWDLFPSLLHYILLLNITSDLGVHGIITKTILHN